MQLIIVSPFSKRAVDVEWVELNTPTGNFIIQPEHAPTIVTLTPGQRIIYMTTGGKEESFIISQAIVQVTRTTVTLLMQDTL
jgi:F0F1-type ATP synthase epsilon subunit